jgi:hypothetical protein
MRDLVLVGGNGKWGKKIQNTFVSLNINYKVADQSNWKKLISDAPAGVIISTPPQSHVEIADFALNKNIPTMIEKPLSLSYQEAYHLKQYTSPTLVNNIHLFSDAFNNLNNFSKLHQIDKIVSLGFNKGPIRDYSSLYDYGSHDISMILYLIKEFPKSVNFKEIKTNTGRLFNIKMQFNKLCSESLVGNGGKKPIRKFKIDCGGVKLIYDDKARPSYYNQPLTNAINVFIDAINGKNDDRLGLDLSLDVLKILDMYGD